MDIKIKNIVEALIFSSDRPLSIKQMKDIINEEKVATGLQIDIKRIETAIEKIKAEYDKEEYSFTLLEMAGGYRFGTKKEYAPWLIKLNKEKLRRKLSQSALETLSIIAYKQPITKPEIEAIRGVNVDYIVGSLLEKNLITIKGRAEAPGRPILYGTTTDLMEYLGINSLEQLPPLKDITEIIKTGPSELITQSDLDFYEEINQLKKAEALDEAKDNINKNGEPEISGNSDIADEGRDDTAHKDDQWEK